MSNSERILALTPQRKSFALGFMACLLGLALVAAVSMPNLLRSRQLVTDASTGLSAYIPDKQVTETLTLRSEDFGKIGGTVGGVPGGSPKLQDDRKIVKTAQLSLIASDPIRAAEAARAVSEELGGYATGLQFGSQGGGRARLTVLVPMSNFEKARAELHKLASRVEEEQVQAEDVTRRYVDTEATLKSYRAEEAQYLQIMHRAGSVKDVLAVTEKLANVRERIEKAEAEFRSLSQQVAMASFTVSLRSETEEQVLGLRWRPLYELKVALRDGTESIGDYTAAMLAVLVRLPAIALWAATILLALKYGWALARRYWAGLVTPVAVSASETEK